MADIDVVPKRRSSAWIWWVLTLVLIVLLVWMLAGNAASSIGGQSNHMLNIGENRSALRIV